MAKYVQIPLDGKFTKDRKFNYVIACWFGQKGWADAASGDVEVPEGYAMIKTIARLTNAGSVGKVRGDLEEMRRLGYLDGNVVRRKSYGRHVSIRWDEAAEIARSWTPRDARVYLYLRGWKSWTRENGGGRYAFTCERLSRECGYGGTKGVRQTLEKLKETGYVRFHEMWRAVPGGAARTMYLDGVEEVRVDEVHTGRAARDEEERVEDIRVDDAYLDPVPF